VSESQTFLVNSETEKRKTLEGSSRARKGKIKAKVLRSYHAEKKRKEKKILR